MPDSLRLPDPQQIPPICACDRCGDELYEADECYLIDGEVICPDCLPDMAREQYAPCQMTAGELCYPLECE